LYSIFKFQNQHIAELFLIPYHLFPHSMHSPAFPFYVQDFIYGTRLMTAEEVGGYIRLLCHQWDKGHLPDDDDVLKRISGIKKTKTLKMIREKFVMGDDQLLRNLRMEDIRRKQQQHNEQRRASALRRWHPDVAATIQAPELPLSDSPAGTGHTILSKTVYHCTTSELMWQQCSAGITELMSGLYASLRLEDVMTEVDRCCPTGTAFNSVQHLLNKFKAVAAAMMSRSKVIPLGRKQEVTVSSRPPIVNL
jgi:uncharacterized protein YdaU (DUF1376 family)